MGLSPFGAIYRQIGKGTKRDPKIMWLVRPPSDPIKRERNEAIAQELGLSGYTHVWLRACDHSTTRTIDSSTRCINRYVMPPRPSLSQDHHARTGHSRQVLAEDDSPHERGLCDSYRPSYGSPRSYRRPSNSYRRDIATTGRRVVMGPPPLPSRRSNVSKSSRNSQKNGVEISRERRRIATDPHITVFCSTSSKDAILQGDVFFTLTPNGEWRIMHDTERKTPPFKGIQLHPYLSADQEISSKHPPFGNGGAGCGFSEQEQHTHKLEEKTAAVVSMKPSEAHRLVPDIAAWPS